MNPDRKIEPEKIHIVNIQTIKGNVDSISELDSTKINGHRYSFELSTGLNVKDKIVALKLVVNIEAIDKADNPVNSKGSYTHEIIFRVENLDDFIQLSKGDGGVSHMIDAALGSTLISIAYSTIRGVIYTRTQGTSLGTVILPVIDPKKLMVPNKE